MFRLLLLLLAAAAVPSHARRRLSLDVCAHRAFVLAQGAPLPNGKVFPPQRGYVDARVDDSGRGTALARKMPICQRMGATSLKIVNPSALWSAVAWLERECAQMDCVVYSAYELPDVNFHVLR